MSIFSSGIVLAQHKEPAFSRPLLRFTNPQTESISTGIPPVTDTDALSADELIEIAKAARIVDERDGKLLFRKLLHVKNRASAIVVDAIDDEPYVSSRINPLLKLREDVAAGISLCKKVTGGVQIFILAYKQITGLEASIPGSVEGYKITKLGGGYPANPQASLLKIKKQGRRLTIGVGALIHLYRAVKLGKKQSTVFITVAGGCVANPANMEVSLGMTVQQIIERCGLVDVPTRIVCGGPMTGIAVMDTERTLVTYTTRAILAVKDDVRESAYNCIGCARCEKVCPAGLNPGYIRRIAASGQFKRLAAYEPETCVGCGTCSYICPARLDISGAVASAGAMFKTPDIDEEADDIES